MGVTTMNDRIYVLRKKKEDEIEVYDADNYSPQRFITVSSATKLGLVDISSCEQYVCLYVADGPDSCVHRLDLEANDTRWPVNDEPSSLSVNAQRNVLVTCSVARKIKEFSSYGELLREVGLPLDVVNPQHTVQLSSGSFVVSHGQPGDKVNRVCTVSEDGHLTVHSHGGQRGSDTGQYNGPLHLAVDDNEFVFVVDFINRRVTKLSATLEYEGQVVSPGKLSGSPCRLAFDTARRHLYVADNEAVEGKWILGRVLVFSV